MKTLLLLLAGLQVVSVNRAQAHALDPIDGAFQGFRTMPGQPALAVTASATWRGSNLDLQVSEKARRSRIAQIEVSAGRKDRAWVESKELRLSETALEPTSEGCLESDSSQIRLCATETSVTLQFASIRFDLTPVKPVAVAAPTSTTSVATSSGEAPRVYTLDELRDRSARLSFNSLVEFEHVAQARALAKNSKMNLLPHLSANSLIAGATGDIAGVLGAIGDFAPFLLPSRWFQKSENRERAAGEAEAFEAMQMDAAFQTELLSLALLRDQEVLASLKDNITRITSVRDELEFRERMGQFSPGIHNDATSLVIQMQKAMSILGESLQEQTTFIAQSAGFMQANAVKGVKPIDLSRRGEIRALSENGRLARVLDRSAELRQIDHLVQAARYNRKGRWFAWMDPMGDPNAGLGFGLGSYVAYGSSQVREMEVRHDQQEAYLASRLHILIAQANLQADLYQQTLGEQTVQDARVNRMLTNIRMGASFALSDLMSALQDSARNRIDRLSAQYNYWMARTALDRLEREGAYKTAPALD